MNNDNNQEIPNNMERIIVDYVFNNPCIEYRDLKKDLTINNKKMTSKTLRYYLFSKENPNNLIKKQHILASGERIYNETMYPDSFNVNDKMLYLYPNLSHKRIIKIISTLEELTQKKRSNLKQEYYLDFQLLQNFNLSLNFEQKGQSRPFYFSDNKYWILKTLLTILIRECFLDNPELWYVFENPEDLDFSLKLNIEYSKVPFFFDYFSFFKDISLKEKRIESTECSIEELSKIIEEIKTESILEQDDLEMFYAKAKFEHERREKNQLHLNIMKGWKEYLKNPNKDFWNFRNREEYLLKWFLFKIENQKRKILDKECSIEKKLLNLHKEKKKGKVGYLESKGN